VIRVLRQSLAVAAHIGASEVKDAHMKPFNAFDFSLNVGYRRHLVSLIIT
jgi:hypothetical protein